MRIINMSYNWKMEYYLDNFLVMTVMVGWIFVATRWRSFVNNLTVEGRFNDVLQVIQVQFVSQYLKWNDRKHSNQNMFTRQIIFGDMC